MYACRTHAHMSHVCFTEMECMELWARSVRSISAQPFCKRSSLGICESAPQLRGNQMLMRSMNCVMPRRTC